MNSHTLGILRQLERGEINVAEANARLNATPAESADTLPLKPELPGWIHWLRVYPLVSGTIIVLIGAWIITSTVNANMLWLVLGLPIVLFGALLLAFGAIFYSAHWLYVNIEQSSKRPRAIRFAIPFPIGVLRAALWFARLKKPNARAEINVNTSRWQWRALWEDPNELMRALERELKQGNGFSVNVEDKGERVQVHIV